MISLDYANTRKSRTTAKGLGAPVQRSGPAHLQQGAAGPRHLGFASTAGSGSWHGGRPAGILLA